VKLALGGDFVPDAVNVQAGGIVAEDVRPGLPLAERLGRVFTALAGGIAASVTVEVRGEIVQHDVSALQLAVLKGVFRDVIEDPVTYVNAPLLAADRGLTVSLLTSRESAEYRNVVTVRGVLGDGREVSVSGTLIGPRQVQKLVEVDGFDIDLTPEGHVLFFRYIDRPGIVGTMGHLLGDAGINIAGMQVARTASGGDTVMAVAVDSPVPGELLATITAAIDATRSCEVDLTPE
jgi:D-3-phosphoglycerate dehydrogenase